MAQLDFPRLRPLPGGVVHHQGQPYVALEDPLGLVPPGMLIPLDGFRWVVSQFDGETSLRDVQARVLRETGQILQAAELEFLVRRLDEAMVLDGPSFRKFREEYARQPERASALAGGAYPADPDELRAQLDSYFRHDRGAGVPQLRADAGKPLRGLLAPHIDFHRGGPVYNHSHRALVEQSDADVFVIFGVSHRYPCRHRFAATRKDFRTPLGTARADGRFLDLLEAHFGHRLFEDELAHVKEWSIEFQVVFLEYLLGGRRPYSIVPILVGSFHDLMERGIDPIQDETVAAFVEALKRAEAERGGRVLYLGSVDFGHIGQEFGDPQLLEDDQLARLRSFDTQLIERAGSNDAAGWFRTAAEVEDKYRTCGLAATYTMLQAMGPAPGRLLRYEQAVNPGRTCCVSFASVAFEAPES
jgi:AmmeMemoRadiSam system protein B